MNGLYQILLKMVDISSDPFGKEKISRRSGAEEAVILLQETRELQ